MLQLDAVWLVDKYCLAVSDKSRSVCRTKDASGMRYESFYITSMPCLQANRMHVIVRLDALFDARHPVYRVFNMNCSFL